MSVIFQISISYCHSIGTRVRLSLLKAISKHQMEHDKDAVCSGPTNVEVCFKSLTHKYQINYSFYVC